MREYKPDVSPDVSRQLTKWKLSLWRYIIFKNSRKLTSSPPFPFTYRLERGEEGSILEIPARFSTTNGLAIFLRLLPLFHRPMFEPVLEKLRDDTIAVIRGKGGEISRTMGHGRIIIFLEPDSEFHGFNCRLLCFSNRTFFSFTSSDFSFLKFN